MAAAHVQSFINQMWPHAVAVGDAYGIDPVTIVTQAAIETGWGSEVAGNNYFGVKSHGRPGGQTLTTHEEINGKRVKVQDDFRVYGNMAESVEDYAKFLRDNPRYANALGQQDYKGQLAGIAGAGYATDSTYGDLVRDVSAMVARAAPPTPPGSIPDRAVGTQLDVTRTAPTPAVMSGQLAEDRAARAAPPTPAPRAQMEVARANRPPQRLLPVIGPTGNPSPTDAIGAMPSRSDMQAFAAPRPVSPSGVTRTQGVAGTVQMPPEARPQIADQLVQQAERGVARQQPVPSGGLVGEEGRSQPQVPKYVTTTKQIPLGDVMHHGSRDSVAQAEAGKALADSGKIKMRTVTTTALNPDWVSQQNQQQVAAAPGLGVPARGSQPVAPGLGQGGTQSSEIFYGSSTGRSYEVGQRYKTNDGYAIAQADGTFQRVRENRPEAPTVFGRSEVEKGGGRTDAPSSGGGLLERIRTSIGLPAEGLGPSIRDAIGLGDKPTRTATTPSSKSLSSSSPTVKPRSQTSTTKSTKDRNTSPGGQKYDRTTGNWV